MGNPDAGGWETAVKEDAFKAGWNARQLRDGETRKWNGKEWEEVK